MPTLDHDFSNPLPNSIVLGGDAVEEDGFVELSPTDSSSGWVDAIIGPHHDLEVTATWGTSDGDATRYDDPGQSFDISVAVKSYENGYRVDRVLSVEWNHYSRDIRLRIDGVQVASVYQLIADTTGSTRVMHESGLGIRHDAAGNSQVIVRFNGSDVLTHDFNEVLFDGDRVRFGALSTEPDYARHGIYDFSIKYTFPPADVYRVGLYRDFSYARVTQTIGESDDTIFVDSVDRFPPNLILAKSRFMLTIESDLQTGDFEIVRLLEVDEVARTLRVQRGMEGTSSAAHQAYTIIKGAVTARTLYRARSLFIFQEMPEVDYDLFVDGDIVWDRSNQSAYVLINDEWISFTANAQAAIENSQASIMHLARSVSEVETRSYDLPTIQNSIALLAGYLDNLGWLDPVLRDHALALQHMGFSLAEIEAEIEAWGPRVDTLEEELDLVQDAHGYQPSVIPSALVIHFSYSMYGNDMGTLSLQVSDDEGDSWETVWSRSGDTGTPDWFEEELSLADFGYVEDVELRFRFHYITDNGDSYRGDAALDAIRITNGDDVDDFFSFETGLEGWVTSGDYDWERHSGGTGSSNTGPASAHDGMHYIYCETSSSGSNDTFIIENPTSYAIRKGMQEEVFHPGLDSLTAAIALG